MSKDISQILATEYSERFDDIRKDMMVVSYYKYGPMKDNYDKYKCMDALGNIEKDWLNTGKLAIPNSWRTLLTLQ